MEFSRYSIINTFAAFTEKKIAASVTWATVASWLVVAHLKWALIL